MRAGRLAEVAIVALLGASACGVAGLLLQSATAGADATLPWLLVALSAWGAAVWLVGEELDPNDMAPLYAPWAGVVPYEGKL